MQSYGFLTGGGEMGERTRQYDWAKTSIGSPDHWPKSLRGIVATILSSRFPMFLWWGQDLIQFYNDAYRPSLGNEGKHPTALGQMGKDCWPEIWDIIYPLISQVLTTGEATWSEDQLVPIYRNGAIEDVYWTFGYSPIRDDEDKISGVLVICTETTQKVNYLRQLTASKKELEFAIDAADLGTWDLNPGTNKFTANPRLKEWFGLRPDEEIELPLAIAAMHEDDRQRVTNAILRALDPASGGYYEIEYRITNPLTNVTRVVCAKGKALFNEEGQPTRFNGTLQDITEQKKARSQIEQVVAERTRDLAERTDALAEANKNLERSNAELSQFAHIASHDLQEPIRKVVTYASMLQDSPGNMGEQAKQYIQKIATASRRMQVLIRDILTYSELSRRSPTFEPVNLQTVVGEMQIEFELLIEQKNARLQYHDLPTIDAIPLQMTQLFSNLISNALKYSSADRPPLITLTSCIRDQQVHIEIHDNGIGFDQQYADHIFSIFQRLHRKTEYSGTGIGLAMCKRIAQNHQGNITATSEPGQGATFHITLPQHHQKPVER
jgi:PAS domain S-box-containing protein